MPARNAKGERLLIYLGIIDILQSYRLLKKLEHTWKSVLHDGVSFLSNETRSDLRKNFIPATASINKVEKN